MTSVTKQVGAITAELKDLRTWDFLGNFIIVLEEQLREDQELWGDTWKHRIKGGQEGRIRAEMDGYWDQWEHGGNDVPWLKIAGLALIAWIRETYPEMFPE